MPIQIHPQTCKDIDAIIEIAERLKKNIIDYRKNGGNVDWVCRVAETFDVIESIAHQAFMREAV